MKHAFCDKKAIRRISPTRIPLRRGKGANALNRDGNQMEQTITGAETLYGIRRRPIGGESGQANAGRSMLECVTPINRKLVNRLHAASARTRCHSGQKRRALSRDLCRRSTRSFFYVFNEFGNAPDQ
jgi:hypothetical protein